MNSEFKEGVVSFLNAFEELFDKDWNYTKERLGIFENTEEQEQNSKEMGLEAIRLISSKGTFLNPGIDDEEEDWGSRASLLGKYRELKKLLSQG